MAGGFSEHVVVTWITLSTGSSPKVKAAISILITKIVVVVFIPFTF
jgi:hypothetical protein